MDQGVTTNRGAVLVTGSSTGIGRATALHLDKLGFRVFAGVRRNEDGEALRAESSARLTPVIIDVSNEQSIKGAFEIISQAVGESGLSGLVNNAAVNHPGPLECLPADNIRQVIETNLIGTMLVIQTFLPLIRKCKGRIVNVGSIGGVSPMPFLAPYNASKAGVLALTTTLRRELAPFGIEVSLIVPGNIKTPIWGKGKASLLSLSQNVGEPYRQAFEACASTLERLGPLGLPPEAVAKVIGKALTDNKPKVRYTIGRDAQKQTLADKWLPARFVDRVLPRLL